MIIYHSSYSLHPRQTLNALTKQSARKGALLKVVWLDGKVGYADLHPWPELGDVNLDQQLADLKQGKLSAQIKQSIWMAQRDSLSRAANKSIFNLNFSDQGLKNSGLIKNNFLISDVALVNAEMLSNLGKQGFTTLKLKAGRNFEIEIRAIELAAAAGFKLRLDFNATGTFETFKKFITSLSAQALSQIEYVEDPCPFTIDSWNAAKELTKIAIDNEYEKVFWDKITTPAWDVIVIKPAKMDVALAMERCEKWSFQATVTSYMDHAVGLTHALAVAQDLKEKYGPRILEAGCMTYHLYEQDTFISEISSSGPYFVSNNGIGVGFDQLLEAEPWVPIYSI